MKEPHRQLCGLERLLLLLPLFWELAIQQGVDTPVHYSEVFLKKIDLPFPARDFKRFQDSKLVEAIQNELHNLPGKTRYLKPFSGSTVKKFQDSVTDLLLRQISLERFHSVNACSENAARISVLVLKALKEDPNCDSISAWEYYAEWRTYSIAHFFISKLCSENPESFDLPKIGVMAMVISTFACLFGILHASHNQSSGEGFVNMWACLAIYFQPDEQMPLCPSSQFGESRAREWADVKQSMHRLYQLDSPFSETSTESQLCDGITVAVTTIIDSSFAMIAEEQFVAFYSSSLGVARLLKIFSIVENGTGYNRGHLVARLANDILFGILKIIEVNFEGKSSRKFLFGDMKFEEASCYTATPIIEHISKLKEQASVGQGNDPPASVQQPLETEKLWKNYDPFAKVDGFIKEEELVTPKFAEILKTLNLHEVNDCFAENLVSEHINDITFRASESLKLMLRTFHETVWSKEAELRMTLNDKSEKAVKLRFSRYKALEISQVFFEELTAIENLLEPSTCTYFKVAEALFRIDKLLFNGQTSVILRGSLPNRTSFR